MRGSIAFEGERVWLRRRSVVKETIGSAALPAPGERGSRSGRSRRGAGERGEAPGSPRPALGDPCGKGKFLLAVSSSSLNPLNLPLGGGWGNGRAAGEDRRGHPRSPPTQRGCPPAGGPRLSPPAGRGCFPPPAPLKRLRFLPLPLGSPSPSLSQTRGTSARARGPWDRTRIFNF